MIMWMHSALQGIFYLGLLALALIFCWKNVEEYMQGITDYAVTNEPITVEDLPTVCICLPPTNKFSSCNSSMVGDYIHHENFWIYVGIFGRVNGKNYFEVTPFEKSNIAITMSGIRFHLETMDPFLKEHETNYPFCYRISPRWDNRKIDILKLIL